MVDVYHELAYAYEVMASVMKALKPGGRVVFALEWERTVSTLPWQHVVVFRKRG